MSIKRGTDYSKSAINLQNTNEVRDLLLALDNAEQMEAIKLGDLVATDAYKDHSQACENTAKLRARIIDAVERNGSYQDIVAGMYAIQQRKTRIEYQAALIRKHAVLGKYADAIIVETVIDTKVAGLIKGGLVTDDDAKVCRTQTDLSPAYIIGVARDGK